MYGNCHIEIPTVFDVVKLLLKECLFHKVNEGNVIRYYPPLSLSHTFFTSI